VLQITKPTLEMIFTQPAPSGAFAPPHLAHCRELGKKRPVVFLAFPPKSAGTFFRTAIIKAVDGQLVRTVYAQGGRDAQLYLPTMLAYYLGSVTPRTMVTHVHFLALEANRYFIEAFDIKPVIIRRPILDMLASYIDHIAADRLALSSLNCEIPEAFMNWPMERRTDYFMDVIAQWYVNYFATWRDYLNTAGDRVLMLDYTDIKNDPAGTVARAVAHSGITAKPEDISSGLDYTWNDRHNLRFNKGVVGRGRVFFKPRHVEQLRKMIGYYPQLDDWADVLLGEATADEIEMAAAG
jgi:Sulfotransferase domain